MYGLPGPTEENTPTSRFENMHSFRTNQTLYTQSVVTYAQITKKFLRSHRYRAKATHKPILSANSDIQKLKKNYKPF
jgi:hypothetical protein